MPVKILGLPSLQRLIKKLGQPVVSKKDAKELGDRVVDEIRELTMRGISPIEGKGRFPGYKRAGDKDGYPNTVKRIYPHKRKRPVNLRLSGDFMESLRSKPILNDQNGGYDTEIGWPDEKNQLKEEGHREGVNGQPKRPIIPMNREDFTSTIKQLILDFYQNRARKWVEN